MQRFFEVVELPKFKILVSEDLRGKSVEEKLAAGRFPAAEACRIARLAALGLAQMHERGRVHGDVRPANILLEPVAHHPGHVKLLVEAHEPPQPIDLSQQDAEGRLAKMADYLAPELMTAGRSPDALTDIYALGCTLYTLLAGKPPFAGGSVQEKMARHASEAIKPLECFGRAGAACAAGAVPDGEESGCAAPIRGAGGAASGGICGAGGDSGPAVRANGDAGELRRTDSA